MIIHSIIMTYYRKIATTIYNSIICAVLIFAGVCCFNMNNKTVAVPLDEEESLSVDYTKFNVNEIKTAADGYFQSALKEEDKEKREQYLKNATTRYYILSNTDKGNVKYYTILGRIYDMRGYDKYAKAYFYNALGINDRDPDANYYFGEYYYSRNNYKLAIKYYQKALACGFKQEPSELLKKMGYIYEQYGDLQRAAAFYKNSVASKPDVQISKKIQDIEGANYSSTGYDSKRIRK